MKADGKEDGKKRPISKPCLEDKIVQRAVVMILEAISRNRHAKAVEGCYLNK